MCFSQNDLSWTWVVFIFIYSIVKGKKQILTLMYLTYFFTQSFLSVCRALIKSLDFINALQTDKKDETNALVQGLWIGVRALALKSTLERMMTEAGARHLGSTSTCCSWGGREGNSHWRVDIVLVQGLSISALDA